jgi:hypothetical protein
MGYQPGTPVFVMNRLCTNRMLKKSAPAGSD